MCRALQYSRSIKTRSSSHKRKLSVCSESSAYFFSGNDVIPLMLPLIHALLSSLLTFAFIQPTLRRRFRPIESRAGLTQSIHSSLLSLILFHSDWHARREAFVWSALYLMMSGVVSCCSPVLRSPVSIHSGPLVWVSYCN